MIKLYLKQAWALLKQNKLFSTLYIIGTGLAIAMTVVMAVIYYVKIVPIYPEVNRSTTYYIHSSSFESEQNQMNWAFSYQAVKEWFYTLQNAEVVSARLSGGMTQNSYIQPADQSGDFSVAVKLTDPAFFRLYEFRFLEGKPFTEADLASGICNAVITDGLARRLFGTTDGIVGRSFTMNYTDYRVCGVVRSASYLTRESFSQIYLPYSVSSDYSQPKYGCDYLGAFGITVKVKNATQAQALRTEVEELQRKYNLSNNGGWQVNFHQQPRSHIDSVFQVYSDQAVDWWSVFRKLGLIVFVLLLVPAINLSGMISSRMESRLAEMGVRKSFGACRRVLLSQVMWENLLLTLLGGLLGLLLAWFSLYVFREWIFSMMDTWPSAIPQGVEVLVTGEMLFAPAVFLAALLFCVVMNLLSALIPAWVSLRKPIVQSLFEKR